MKLKFTPREELQLYNSETERRLWFSGEDYQSHRQRDYVYDKIVRTINLGGYSHPIKNLVWARL